jgi:hypothetical protein
MLDALGASALDQDAIDAASSRLSSCLGPRQKLKAQFLAATGCKPTRSQLDVFFGHQVSEAEGMNSSEGFVGWDSFRNCVQVGCVFLCICGLTRVLPKRFVNLSVSVSITTVARAHA